MDLKIIKKPVIYRVWKKWSFVRNFKFDYKILVFGTRVGSNQASRFILYPKLMRFQKSDNIEYWQIMGIVSFLHDFLNIWQFLSPTRPVWTGFSLGSEMLPSTKKNQQKGKETSTLNK